MKKSCISLFYLKNNFRVVKNVCQEHASEFANFLVFYNWNIDRKWVKKKICFDWNFCEAVQLQFISLVGRIMKKTSNF